MASTKFIRFAFAGLMALPLFIFSCNDTPNIHKLWKYKKTEALKPAAKDTSVNRDSIDPGSFDLRNSTVLVNTITRPEPKSFTVPYQIEDSLIVVNPDTRMRHTFKIASLSETELTLIPQNERGGVVALMFEAAEEE